MSQIVPDGKDWTVVLDTVCEQCGYDVRGISPGDSIEQLPGHVERYISVLARPDAATRTNPARWSDQEYVVHVAEMLEVMTGRFTLMLERDEPEFPNWDQDQAADDGNYNALPSSEVAELLRKNAAGYAAKLEGMDPVQYSRRGLRSNGAAFTVETLNQYAWHDHVHHLWDLGVEIS
ncbi:DinB family protein [Glutamicibacter sp. HZAU]|uniref:DinB family protein n=1 Tax=Glutamicibacter sp. HZAU TaxID=2049891 RepID=UPI000FFB6DDF|nr:DinB family protein [Glutamicibacter sp. HZAU]RWZ82175.1 DinB family protein [Glutamicibacter sp. HZAU]